ncbi:biopolymer transporter Tol [Microbacterium mangrovi]|uniref:Biopolymer transporter Tol n=1 Tax=Microbacterium mangrovi TaxID=1348253 RepID=A0A0B2A0F7_9MICO|nr:PD40 domain-containing protein [Microbacterium mangrovi]KHK95242.1 biopolymer transporter Tol [Microbacterium mangrovi]
MSYRTLGPNQSAHVHIYDTDTGADVVILESTDILFEAPNWSRDGSSLLLNGHGRLWSLSPEGGQPSEIPLHGIPALNNDHVLAPDGTTIYLSAEDQHVYRAPLSGGTAERVTPDDGTWHFLHGVSPDGERLAYTRITTFDQPGTLAVMSAEGGMPTIIDTGHGHIDGPEWSPDGKWIYLNTERWATRPGHAQLARLPDGGGELERLVESETVDWFPHLSPDGTKAVYIEFPPGTEGHPADLDVALVVVDTADWTTPLTRIPLPGGQGTINVNSWSPDSRRFAYVSYPFGSA